MSRDMGSRVVAKLGKPRFPKAKLYPLVVECIERAIDYGWNRAHKHVDDPTEEMIKIAINDAILNDLCETFDF
jgi:hypothetical protein